MTDTVVSNVISLSERYVKLCEEIYNDCKADLARGRSGYVWSEVFLDHMVKMKGMSEPSDPEYTYEAQVKEFFDKITRLVKESPWYNEYQVALGNKLRKIAIDEKNRIADAKLPRENHTYDSCPDGQYVEVDKSDKPANQFIVAQQVFKYMGVKGSYNLFTNRKQITLDGESLDVSTTGALRNKMYDFCFVTFSDKVIKEAIDGYCRRYPFHPIKDYFESVRHFTDKNIIDTWLTTLLGAEPNELNREIGKKMLVAMVARIYEPGKKFDQMPVFEGSQGLGKSEALKRLVGEEYYSNGDVFTANKQQRAEWLKGRMLFEAAELSGHSKAEISSVKDFLSTTSDNVRGAYKEDVVDNRRTCIMVGTTNPEEYLTDDTGNRRFWPVKCCMVDTDTIHDGQPTPKEANIAWLDANRDQLWNEALRLYESNYSLVLNRNLWPEVAKLQQSRMITSTYADSVLNVFGLSVNEGLYIFDQPEKHYLDIRIWSDDIFKALYTGTQLHVVGKHINYAMRTVSIINSLKWEYKKTMRINGSAPLAGYQLTVTNKEEYDDIKLLIETMKKRRGSRIMDQTL